MGLANEEKCFVGLTNEAINKEVVLIFGVLNSGISLYDIEKLKILGLKEFTFMILVGRGTRLGFNPVVS